MQPTPALRQESLTWAIYADSQLHSVNFVHVPPILTLFGRCEGSSTCIWHTLLEPWVCIRPSAALESALLCPHTMHHAKRTRIGSSLSSCSSLYHPRLTQSSHKLPPMSPSINLNHTASMQRKHKPSETPPKKVTGMSRPRFSVAE